MTQKGAVKVLDFGLAKAKPSNQPTCRDVADDHGPRDARRLMLGTAAYMSPEQASGRAVDKRADIWAFGCVLFEMLTGGRAFGRETMTDTLAAIVERDPDWRALPAGTPDRVLRLLRRCLEKDVTRRLRDIGDVTDFLDGDLHPAPPAATRRRGSAFAAGIAAAIAVAVGLVTWVVVRPQSDSTRGMTTGTLEALTFDEGLTMMPALSPDGRPSRTRRTAPAAAISTSGCSKSAAARRSV